MKKCTNLGLLLIFSTVLNGMKLGRIENSENGIQSMFNDPSKVDLIFKIGDYYEGIIRQSEGKWSKIRNFGYPFFTFLLGLGVVAEGSFLVDKSDAWEYIHLASGSALALASSFDIIFSVGSMKELYDQKSRVIKKTTDLFSAQEINNILEYIKGKPTNVNVLDAVTTIPSCYKNFFAKIKNLLEEESMLKKNKVQPLEKIVVDGDH